MQPLRRILSRQLLLIQVPLMAVLMGLVWWGTRTLLLEWAQRDARSALGLAVETLDQRLTAVERAAEFVGAYWRQGRLHLEDPESTAALLMPWLSTRDDLIVLNLVDNEGRAQLYIRTETGWRLREIQLLPDGQRPLRWMNVGPEGLVPPQIPRKKEGRLDPRLRPWYQETRQLRTPAWSQPYAFDPPESKRVVTYLVPLPESHGRPGGALGFDLPAKRLDGLLDSLRPTPGSAFWLLDGQGAVLASSGVASDGPPPVPGKGPLIPKGATFHTAGMAVPGHAGASWQLLLAIPERDMLASAHGRLWGLTAAAGLLLLLPFGWVLVQGARLSRVIQDLADGALHMGSGTRPEPVVTHVEEFHILSQALRQAHQNLSERQELQRQFLLRQRLETLGTLAGGIAHDVNNQLNATLMHLRMAQEAAGSGEALQGRLAKAEEAVTRCAKTTRDLLAFGQKGRPDAEPLRLNELVQRNADMLRRVLGGRISVEVDLEDGLPLILGEAQQLEQVLLNLGVNARDAMPEGGTLCFRTRSLASGRVRLSVSDSGSGIRPEVLPHVFEPFFTTKPVGEGSGLGLAVAYGILQSHGGSLHVESSPGQGATFHLDFPVLQPDPEPQRSEISPSSSGLRVLVVEDETSLREALVEILQMTGMQAVGAEDGEAGWDAFQRGTWDAVVSDQRMPRLTGTGLLQRIRDKGHRVPFILASGQDLEPSRAQWGKDGAVGFLPKPFTLAQLQGVLAGLVR